MHLFHTFSPDCLISRQHQEHRLGKLLISEVVPEHLPRACPDNLRHYHLNSCLYIRNSVDFQPFVSYLSETSGLRKFRTVWSCRIQAHSKFTLCSGRPYILFSDRKGSSVYYGWNKSYYVLFVGLN